MDKYLKYKHRYLTLQAVLRGGGAKWDGTKWTSDQRGVPGQYSRLEATALNLLKVRTTQYGLLPGAKRWWSGETVVEIIPNTLPEAIAGVADRATLRQILTHLAEAARLRLSDQSTRASERAVCDGHIDFAKSIINASYSVISSMSERATREQRETELARRMGRRWVTFVRQSAEDRQITELTEQMGKLTISDEAQLQEDVVKLDEMIGILSGEPE